jgi:hypothetical protein
VRHREAVFHLRAFARANSVASAGRESITAATAAKNFEKNKNIRIYSLLWKFTACSEKGNVGGYL